MPVNETDAIQLLCGRFLDCKMLFLAIFEFFGDALSGIFKNIKWISKPSIAHDSASNELRNRASSKKLEKKVILVFTTIHIPHPAPVPHVLPSIRKSPVMYKPNVADYIIR